MDGTGFSLNSKSEYYSIRSKIKEGKGKKKRRNFLKIVTLVDTESKLILDVKGTRMDRNEIKLGETIIKRNSDLKCKYIVADKAYDSQNYHDLAKQNLSATAIIPVRNLTDKLHRTKGKDRKRLKQEFNKEIYKKRNICETIFSMIKRNFTSRLKSKKVKTQNTELLITLITHNLLVLSSP